MPTKKKVSKKKAVSRPRARVSTSKKRTYVAILVDASSSMQGIRTGTVATLNSMLDTIRDQSNLTNQETIVSLLSFADFSSVMIPPTDINHIGRVSEGLYRPNGMTALFDAVGDGVELLQTQLGSKSKDTSFLVMAITDGQENASRYHDRQGNSLRTLMRAMEGTDQWTFTFQVPNGQARNFSTQFGISPDNIREWEASSRGVADMAHVNNAGFGNYFAGRAAGQKSTKKFFAPVTTDLGSIKTSTLKRELDKVTSSFKVFEVAKEASIKEFVESKTKRPYQVGSAFYLLMKKEEVQPQKGVLLMEKGKPEIFGGDGARDLIGLPPGEFAKVTPGNHSNYDIFVQSTSTNRILPRGTKVLVEVR